MSSRLPQGHHQKITENHAYGSIIPILTGKWITYVPYVSIINNLFQTCMLLAWTWTTWVSALHLCDLLASVQPEVELGKLWFPPALILKGWLNHPWTLRSQSTANFFLQPGIQIECRIHMNSFWTCTIYGHKLRAGADGELMNDSNTAHREQINACF